MEKGREGDRFAAAAVKTKGGLHPQVLGQLLDSRRAVGSGGLPQPPPSSSATAAAAVLAGKLTPSSSYSAAAAPAGKLTVGTNFAKRKALLDAVMERPSRTYH